MIDCNRRWAEKLLSEELTQIETFEFEEHLSHCATCQGLLVEIAGGQEMVTTANGWLASSIELPQWQPIPASKESKQVLDTTQLPNLISDEPLSHEQFENVAIDLSMLGPTDDPSFMGRIGNYEIQGVIGRGGMGIVFRALDRALSRNVAIKVLDPCMASVSAARKRFALEARAMAAISHEHVVPVYAVDEHRNLPYFAMEYIPGGTLESRIRKNGPLDVLSILRISRQIALALSAAHECGLVHRDIKPANVLIDKGIERVRVADFGLARVNSDASHTRSGFIAGTPQFMSPEQVRGDICTAQSDLFSLGSVMYAMCTGASPFQCESLYGSMQRVVHDRPKSIRELAPNVPEWLERFIFVLLEKTPEKRFQTASEVALRLELEIAHSQNPVTHSKPDRSSYEQIVAPKLDSKIRAALIGLATAAMLCLVVFALSRFWTEQPTATKAPKDNEPAFVVTTNLPPLWSNDGTTAVQRDFEQLSRNIYSNELLIGIDPWQSNVQSLREQLDMFEKNNQ